MQMDGEVRLAPAWKHALSVLLERGLEDGEIVEKAELVEMFGLKKPETAAEQEKFQFEFLRQFQKLRDELLEEHRLALRTMHGESAYQVIPPMNQTDYALAEGQRELKQVIRKMTRNLVFVRQEALSDEERRKNADAQAKAAMLAGMVRKPMLELKKP